MSVQLQLTLPKLHPRGWKRAQAPHPTDDAMALSPTVVQMLEVVQLTGHQCALMRQRRKLLKLTLKRLALQCNVSFRTVSSWEIGDRRPSVEHYEAWRHALDV